MIGADLTQFGADFKLQPFIERKRAEPRSFEEVERALEDQMRAHEQPPFTEAA